VHDHRLLLWNRKHGSPFVGGDLSLVVESPTSFAVSDVNVTDDAMRQAVLGHQIRWLPVREAIE
jgi:hypothetical protein